MQEFTPIYPGQKKTLAFDMTNDLTPVGATLQGVPVVTVLADNDPNPNELLNGAASINTQPITKLNGQIVQPGYAVLQSVQGVIPKVRYILKASCGSTDPNTSPTVAGVLEVAFP